MTIEILEVEIPPVVEPDFCGVFCTPIHHSK